jgi:hypothetical protein
MLATRIRRNRRSKKGAGTIEPAKDPAATQTSETEGMPTTGWPQELRDVSNSWNTRNWREQGTAGIQAKKAWTKATVGTPATAENKYPQDVRNGRDASNSRDVSKRKGECNS